MSNEDLNNVTLYITICLIAIFILNRMLKKF